RIETGQLDERESQQAKQNQKYEDAEQWRAKCERITHDSGAWDRTAHDELDRLPAFEHQRLEVELVGRPSELHGRPAARRAEFVPCRFAADALLNVVDLKCRRAVGVRVSKPLFAPPKIPQPTTLRRCVLIENGPFCGGDENQLERVGKRQFLHQSVDAVPKGRRCLTDSDEERRISEPLNILEDLPLDVI